MNIVQEAAALGWHDKEAHVAAGRSEESWVDAEAYVERGRQILPIVNERNKKLLAELNTIKGENASLKTTLDEVRGSVKDLIAFHEEATKAQVKKVREELLAELKVAKTEGDIDAEIKLTSELSSFDAAAATVKEVPKKETVAEVPTGKLHPEVAAWMEVNSWYGSDARKSGLMDGITRELKIANPTWFGKKLLDAALVEVEATLNPESKRMDKTESGQGSGGGGSGSGSSGASGQSFSDLPADAKAICNKQAERFVGENKVFKTAKDWQAHYAAQYFGS